MSPTSLCRLPRLACALFAAFCASLSFSAEQPAVRPPSVLQWETKAIETAIEAHEPILEVRYRFSNTSQQSVKITEMAASCDCVSVTYHGNKSIAPGERGEIAVTYRPEGVSRREQQTITVRTDVPGADAAVLKLGIKVFESIGAWPDVSDWSIGGENAEKAVTVRLDSKLPSPVLRVTNTESEISARLAQGANPHEYVVWVRPISTDRALWSRVVVKVSSSGNRTGTASFYIRVR